MDFKLMSNADKNAPKFKQVVQNTEAMKGKKKKNRTIGPFEDEIVDLPGTGVPIASGQTLGVRPPKPKPLSFGREITISSKNQLETRLIDR